ncbi:MAG: acetyl-CoA hydrolase/transferase family protein [Candidatus Omnitrophica bacterium]|nr:acetyl-CoA hydrolase/transferase family protein [Candidatus Omnitrophota bacterium]
MVDWKQEYKQKTCSAEDAVKCIKSSNRVITSHACGEPQELVRAMVKNAEAVENVEIVHMVAFGTSDYCKPEMAKHFRHNSLFAGPGSRQALLEGRADYTPCYLHDIPRLFREYLPVDVALIQVAPPNKEGYCSFGTSVDYTKPATESAKLVVAQVNENMPFTLGNSLIHISDIDHIVEFNEPIVELPWPGMKDTEKKIGENVAELISDGCVLQLGIGNIPDAILTHLKDKKNLGIHTELICDNIVPLIENGVINNSTKKINNGKLTAAMLMGTKKFYNFMDYNEMLEMQTVEYTNDPCVIRQNDNFISVNSALQVDLMGQVAADAVGTYQYSGVGGQVDHVRGASLSKGGKSIIALPSTAKGGTISRIAPFLDKGTPVTTNRHDVHFIVTEYGVAELRGKTLKQRAHALINIAHPKFKEELEKELIKRGF